MKATVQYNDYVGTTAADRCDLFVELPGQMDQNIIDSFKLPLNADEYHFKGVSVFGTDVNGVSVYLFFTNKESGKIVKLYKAGVSLQKVLNMFKRFEFQVGDRLDKIAEDTIEEIEND
jgi:hypothetical protein